MPSELREALERMQAGDRFYATQGPNDALWLMPDATFSEMVKAFKSSLLPNQKVTEYSELVFSQTRVVELDKNGRVLLPEEMLVETGVGDEIAILGMNDHMEVWNAEKWKKEAAERRARKKELMERAMGVMEEKRMNTEG
ncbi:MAG TPA: hypothetical protein VG711_05970 [Phycisphaerales bacterium]|nr:hypothetical protein [Phycisphaerales bacterium]